VLWNLTKPRHHTQTHVNIDLFGHIKQGTYHIIWGFVILYNNLWVCGLHIKSYLTRLILCIAPLFLVHCWPLPSDLRRAKEQNHIATVLENGEQPEQQNNWVCILIYSWRQRVVVDTWWHMYIYTRESFSWAWFLPWTITKPGHEVTTLQKSSMFDGSILIVAGHNVFFF